MSLVADVDATVDDDVEFAVTVANGGSDPIELTFQSGLDVDVAVFPRGDDEPVWRWSDDRMFTQAVQTRTLEPDDRLERTYTWEDPPAGEYEAVATLANERDVEARTEFAV